VPSSCVGTRTYNNAETELFSTHKLGAEACSKEIQTSLVLSTVFILMPLQLHVVSSGRMTMNNNDECGNSHGLFQDTIPAFSRKYSGKTQNTSKYEAGVLATTLRCLGVQYVANS
jgi:hypothetical protein